MHQKCSTAGTEVEAKRAATDMILRCHRHDFTQLYSGTSFTSCLGFFLYQFYYNPQIGTIISYSKSLLSEAVDVKQ